MDFKAVSMTTGTPILHLHQSLPCIDGGNLEGTP